MIAPATAQRPDPRAAAEEPWQLRLFAKTLKKKQKMAQLLDHLGPTRADERLLLVTNGDNNGAMNWHFRARPGCWTWAELERGAIPEMAAFLAEDVVHVRAEGLGFPDAAFDTVVVIDVHEHLEDPSALNRELFRVVRPGGRAIVTVPNGDSRRLGMALKRAFGMTKEVYGHVRDGYTIPDLRGMLTGAGFRAVRESSYSRFFTEMVELALNVAYVKLLSRRGNGAGARANGHAAAGANGHGAAAVDGHGAAGADGHDAAAADSHGLAGGGHGGAAADNHAPIAPSSADQIRRVRKTLRAYGAVYPACRAISSLDRLLEPFTTGYAVTVEFVKPEAGA